MRRYHFKNGREVVRYEVGDKVKITRKDIFHLKNVKGKNRWGRITDIDGEYIMVKPRYKRWEIELYRCEIEPFEKVSRNAYIY